MSAIGLRGFAQKSAVVPRDRFVNWIQRRSVEWQMINETMTMDQPRHVVLSRKGFDGGTGCVPSQSWTTVP